MGARMSVRMSAGMDTEMRAGMSTDRRVGQFSDRGRATISIGRFGIVLGLLGALLISLGGCGADRGTRPNDLAPTDRAATPFPTTTTPTLAPTNIDPPNSPPIAMPNPLRVNRNRLIESLTVFSEPRFTDSERDRARLYIENSLRDRGWRSRRETFAIPQDDRPDLTGINIVAEKPGTNPSLAPLLVGAHYDTVRDSPGADDNASGAIALLEIAQLLGDPNLTFPRGLRLVWFDLEEFGLLGSFYHVNQLAPADTDAADRPDAFRRPYGAIVLEMLGYACDEPGCQVTPSGLAIALPDRGNFLGVVGNAEAPELLAPFEAARRRDAADRDRLGYPPIETLAVPTQLAIAPNLLRSDHVPFWAAGIGALMVTDTANFRNPHYHRRSDTPDTLDPDFLARSSQAILDATIALLDSTAASPQTTSDPTAERHRARAAVRNMVTKIHGR